MHICIHISIYYIHIYIIHILLYTKNYNDKFLIRIEQRWKKVPVNSNYQSQQIYCLVTSNLEQREKRKTCAEAWKEDFRN